MLSALGELEQKMIESYQQFMPLRMDKYIDQVRLNMQKEYKEGIRYTIGRKFLKLICISNQDTVWGFINLKHDKFKEGDILKSAGWNGPALNKARGNIFKDYTIAWTGPHYLI
jgi:hypothetical protein